jgi:excisionase family DNA binding protein
MKAMDVTPNILRGETGENAQVLLTVREAANLLRLTPGTLYHLSSEGRVPGIVRLSRRCLRFRRDSLLLWIAEQSAAATLCSTGTRGRGR